MANKIKMDRIEMELFKGCGKSITPIESCGDTKEPEFPFDMCKVCEAKIIQHRDTKKEMYKKMDDMETESANNPNFMRTYKCMWNELKDALVSGDEQ